MCVRLCVCACVRVCVRACVHVYVRACMCVCVAKELEVVQVSQVGDFLFTFPIYFLLFVFSSTSASLSLCSPSLLRSKILKHNDHSLVDMEDDMMLLCQNTCTYSQKGSQTLRNLCLPSLTSRLQSYWVSVSHVVRGSCE